jgi:BioD-like phosphotransacetylase family protein
MVLKMLRRTTIPVLHVETDAYTLVAEVHAANFKILPTDGERIARAIETVQSHVDIDLALQGLSD